MRLIGVLVALVLLAGCGGENETPEKVSASPTTSAAPSESESALAFQATGIFAIKDPTGVLADDYHCQGRAGYDDLRPGAQVVVRDADGTQVAIGELGNGDVQRDGTCEFGLLVFGVPPTSDIYTIEVADRGEVSFTRADAEKGLALTVG